MPLWAKFYAVVTAMIFICILVIQLTQYFDTKSKQKKNCENRPTFSTLVAETCVATLLWPVIGTAILIKHFMDR